MPDSLRILLVEDDEDDFLLTQSMLRSAGRDRFTLEWEQSYEPALRAIRQERHDVYLVDYRLGESTGLDLVREAWDGDPTAPVILLTGQNDYEVDLEASELGVTDYLVKGTIDAPSLERTIRYAVRHHQATVALRRSEERYAVALRATNDVIWDWDLQAGTMHFSDRWLALLGDPERSDSTGPDAWFERVHPDDLEQLQQDIREHLAGDSPSFENEHRIRGADGAWRWLLTRGLTTRDPSGTPLRITGSHADITERRHAQQRLLHDALHDSLTGLPNRALFMDRVVQSLAKVEHDPAHGCAVLYIDLDRFKLVNDSLSHAAGDTLLVELSRRTKQLLRPQDTLARLGGDEFTVLLDGIDSPEEAMDVATRANEKIAEPVDLDGRKLPMAASIGVAHNFDGETTADDMIRHADIAMYDAKGLGGGRARMFDVAMHHRVIDRVSLEAQLRLAIEQEGLRTFFQPIVDLRTGALHGLEALARWPKDWPVVTPAEFIPIAEEGGLISPLSTLMLRSACRALGQWRDEKLVGPEVTVSVNVSPRQLHDASIVDQVRVALDEATLPPASLVLEVTESTLIENPELVNAVLGELLDLGVSLQLDDFGTGYSSLTALHGFPGDTLKIDRSFVDTMVDRSDSRTIIRSIIGLAHSLGLQVVAEGIEGPRQLDALSTLECEYGQGYHFARPMPKEQVRSLLEQCDEGRGSASVWTSPTLL